MLAVTERTILRELKPHFWVGAVLLLAGHALIFARTASGENLRPFSDFWFAAVWFGYIFVADALLFLRDGRSLFISLRPLFFAMLPMSAAVWWGFEGLNNFVKNWHYLKPPGMPDWYESLIYWICFSTVIPAIWETAQLVSGWQLLQRLPRLRGFKVKPALLLSLIIIGVISFILPVVWPRYFFPLIWVFAILILDPINYWRGAPSILGYLSRGDWRVPASFYLGGLICGILWEFWNYWAFPKWIYEIPFVGFFKVFEMPLLGYLGYGPFAWEIYALVWFVLRFALGPQELQRLEDHVVSKERAGQTGKR